MLTAGGDLIDEGSFVMLSGLYNGSDILSFEVVANSTMAGATDVFYIFTVTPR